MMQGIAGTIRRSMHVAAAAAEMSLYLSLCLCVCLWRQSVWRDWWGVSLMKLKKSVRLLMEAWPQKQAT